MLEKLRESELARGSLILVFAMGMFNLMNLIFHFISGRLLGPEYYGTLAAIMGIVYIFNVPSEGIQTIISRYTTKFSQDKGKLKSLLSKGLKRFFVLGLVTFLILSLVSPVLGDFLNIESSLLILTFSLLILVFVVSVNRGVMQGTKKFSALGLNFFAEGIIKLSFVVLLILVGLQLYGAIIGILIGAVFAAILSVLSLRRIIKVKGTEVKMEGIYLYSLPVFISIAAITLMYSIDLILAKRFFPDIVGQYAAISMLGKIIFFGTMPIGKAMFPFVSERNEKKADSKDLLKKSLGFVFILSLLALITYYLFPNLIIKVLYGADFLILAPYLLLPSLAMALLAFSNIFVYYNLCSHRKNLNYFLILFVVLQIVLLSIFNSSILQFMIANIAANLVLFLAMLVLILKK